MSGGVIICGDPHGDWGPLLVACHDERPDAVVILGDCDLELPLHRQIGRVFDAGIRVRWIPGNHDVDTIGYYDNLWGDLPEGNLHARWEKVDGPFVAGLDGVFKGRVWYPRFDVAVPVHASRQAYLRQVLLPDRRPGGLPFSARDTMSRRTRKSWNGFASMSWSRTRRRAAAGTASSASIWPPSPAMPA